MRKTEFKLMLISDRQIWFIYILEKLKIIKEVGAYEYMLHPITEEQIIFLQRIECLAIFEDIIHTINRKLLTKRGQEIFEQMKMYGYIKPLDKGAEFIETPGSTKFIF